MSIKEENKNLFKVLCIVILLILIIIIGFFMLNEKKETGVFRDISSKKVSPGETFQLKLDVIVEGNEKYYLIEEKIPEGFEILDYESNSNKIKLFQINQPISNKVYEYEIKAPQEEGTYYFEGKYAFEGKETSSEIKGINQIIIQ